MYPLVDLDEESYTGPKEMGVSLSPGLDRRLRDLQSRWQEWQYHGGDDVPEDDHAAWAAEFDAVERDLAMALQGTGWVLIKRDERTEEQRRRRCKSKRKRR